MNAQEIIDYIAASEKKTPVKVYVNTTGPVDFGDATVFGLSLIHISPVEPERVCFYHGTLTSARSALDGRSLRLFIRNASLPILSLLYRILQEKQSPSR